METITKIEVITKPLKKHLYSFEEMKEPDVPIENRRGSQLLVSAYIEREEREKEIEERALPPSLEGIEPTEEEKPKIRKLTKPKFSIFDYSEIEHDQLEENVAALINQDGYYDEMIPFDEGREENISKEGLGKKIVLITLAVIITALIIYFILRV